MKRRFDPNYLKVFLALRLTEERDKRKKEKEAKEREDAIARGVDPDTLKAEGSAKKREESKGKDKKDDGKIKLTQKFNLDNLRENIEETQKKMPPEDYENKKLFPILQEAYDLVAFLENKKK